MLDLHCIEDATREIRIKGPPGEYLLRRKRILAQGSRLIRQPNLSQPSSRPSETFSSSRKGHLCEWQCDSNLAHSIFQRSSSVVVVVFASFDLIEYRAPARFGLRPLRWMCSCLSNLPYPSHCLARQENHLRTASNDDLLPLLGFPFYPRHSSAFSVRNK